MRLSDTVHFTLHNLLLVLQMNPPGAAYFSRHTADVTFLILQTLYSNQTPSPPAADVVILILYILLSHCIKFFSYCRCDPRGVAHFLYSYCRCDFFDSADFLLTQHTPSFYYTCTLVIIYTFSSHCTGLPLYCRCNPPDTEHFFSWHCRCDILYNGDFLHITNPVLLLLM